MQRKNTTLKQAVMKTLIYLLLIYFPAKALYAQEVDTLYGTRILNEKYHERLIEKLRPKLISFVTDDGYHRSSHGYVRYTCLYLPNEFSSKNLRKMITRLTYLEPGITVTADWKIFFKKEPYIIIRVEKKMITFIYYPKKRKFPNELTVVSYLEIYE